MRVLIVGLGSIAAKHISVLRNIFNDDIEIFALRSSKHGLNIDDVRNIYQLNELNFKPDFIIIANNTSLHSKTILKLAYLGSPLMIEKPIMDSLFDSQTVKDKLQEFNVRTYCACNMRFHPVIQFLKENIDRMGPINEVNIYCGSYLPTWRKNVDFRNSYSARTDMGGGVHLDLIHEIDYSIWLFGLPAEVRSLKRNSSSLKINSIDFALFNLIYDNFVATIILNYYRRDSKRSIEIIFENDTWSIDLLKGQILNSHNEVVFSKKFEIMQTYVDQMNYFLDKIKTGEEFMNSYEESLEILKLAV